MAKKKFYVDGEGNEIQDEEYDGRVKGNKTKEEVISEHKRSTAKSAMDNAKYKEDYDVLKTDFTKKRDSALSGLNDISKNPAKYGKAGVKLASVYQSDLDFYESKIKEVDNKYKKASYRPKSEFEKQVARAQLPYITEDAKKLVKKPQTEKTMAVIDAVERLQGPRKLTLEDYARSMYELDKYGADADAYFKYNTTPHKYGFMSEQTQNKYYSAMDKYGKIAVESGETDMYRPTGRNILDPYEMINAYYNTRKGDKYIEGMIPDELTQMTEGERKLYMTLHNHSEKDANDFLAELRPILEERATQKEQEETREKVKRSWADAFVEQVKSVAKNVAYSPFAAAEAVTENVGDMLFDRESDGYNSAIQRQLYNAQAARDAFTEGWHPIFGSIYKGGMSLVDSTVGSLMGMGLADPTAGKVANGILKSAGSLNMASGALTSAMQDAHTRGLSSGKQLTEGAIAGAAAYLSEKMGMERLFGKKSGGIVKNFIKGGGSEALEEGSEWLVNTGADYVIAGEKSNIAQNGIKNSLKELGLEAIGAFVSGGMASGAAGGISNARHNGYLEKVGSLYAGKSDLLIDLGVETAENSSYKQIGQAVEEAIAKGLEKDGSMENIAKTLGVLEGRKAGTVLSDDDMRAASAVTSYILHGESEASLAAAGRSGSAYLIIDAIADNDNVKNSVKEAFSPEKIGAEMRQNEAVQSLIETGLESPRMSLSHALALTAEGKGIDKLGDKEIGELYLANLKQVAKEGSMQWQTNNAYMRSAGANLLKNPDAMQRVLEIASQRQMRNDSDGRAMLAPTTEAESIIQKMKDGRQVTADDARFLVESVAVNTAKNGDLVGMVKLIDALDGGNTDSIGAAKAVMNLANGKGTNADYADIRKSNGAVTVFSAVNAYAEQMRNNNPSSGDHTGSPLRKGGLVMNEAAMKLDKGVRANIQTFAKRTGSTVILEHGLVDENGEAIMGEEKDGVIRINADYADVAHSIAVHEFTHLMKKIAPKAYEKFRNYVVSKMKNEGTYEGAMAKLREDYEDLSDEGLIDELCAHTAERLFHDEAELTGFIKKDRTLAEWVKDAWLKVLDMLGRTDERTHAQLMWKKCVKEAASGKNKDAVTGEVRYKKEYSFNKQVDDALDNKMKSGYSVYVGRLPNLLTKCGLNPELVMLMNQGHLRDVAHEKDGMHDEYHEIPREIIKQVPELLKRPAAIYDSISEKNKENCVCILTTKCDKDGNPIIIIIENSDRDSSYLNLKMETVKVKASNYVKSMYGRRGFFSHMDDVIKNDSVLYSSKNGIEKLFAEIERTNAKNKKPKLNSDSKLQLLTRLDNLGFDTIIHQSKNVVNTKSMQNVENNSTSSQKRPGVSEKLDEYIGFDNPTVSGADSGQSGTPVPTTQGEAMERADVTYDSFLNENGGGIQAFRPSKEAGWLSAQWIAERSGDNTEVVKSLNEISAIISNDFGIPITSRKFKDEDVAGSFNPTAEVIHTRARNDIITISHEVGHLLDKKLKMQKLDGIDMLVGNFNRRLSVLGYDENAKRTEAVGEFVRMYLTNKDIAKTFAPEYYASFESALSESGYEKAVLKLANAVNSYLSSTVSERIDLAISGNEIDARNVKEKTSDAINAENIKQKLIAKKEKFPELWHQFNSELIDRFYEIGNAQGRVYAKNPQGKYDAHLLATNSLNSAARSAYILTKSFVNMDGEEIGMSFIDCITPVHSKNAKERAANISLLNRYLVLKHALEWLEPKQKDGKLIKKDMERKRVFADERLENPEVLREEITKIEKAFPQVKQAAENIYQYLRNLKKYWGVETGLMTDKLSETLDAMYPCYVPFFRESKNKGIRGARINLANQRAPILEATGGDGMIVNPLESIIRLTEKYVKTASRNMAMQALAHMADSVEGTGFIIERADGKQQDELVGEKDLYKNTKDSAKAAPEELREITTEEDVWKREYQNGQGYVSVLIGGKRVWYQINDERLFKAVADMEPKQLNKFLKGCNVVLNVKRALITSNNPLFTITNLVRDAKTAYNNIDINKPFIYLGMYAKAFYHVLRKHENYKRWCAMGGGHSSELSANMNNVSRALNKATQTSMPNKIMNSILHPIETIASINDAVESTPRLLAFEHEMKRSGDVHRAINKADDITTNFKRGGRTAKNLNNVFMFSNAAIQGLDRTVRSFTKEDTENGRRNRVIKYALSAIFFSVLHAVWNRKDDETEEEYRNLSKYMQRANFVLSIGDGDFLRIPTAREQDLLRVIITDAINYGFGDKEAFDGLVGFVIDTLWPWYVEIPMETEGKTGADILTNMVINTARNTPFGTFTDFAANEDFMGRPIVPESYEDTIAEEQYDEKTSKLAVFIGKICGESPFKVDYIINNNLGILGTLNKSLFPMDSKQKDLSFGFKSRWIADSYYSTDVLNKIYTKRDSASENVKRYGDGNSTAEYEKVNAAAVFITQCNKAIKELPENEKREARGRLNTIMNEWGNGDSPLTEELTRLFDVTGENLFMKFDKRSVGVYGGKRNMTFDEYIKYAENYTAAFESTLGSVISGKSYKGMNDAEKVDALKKATEYAEDCAKAEALPDYELSTWEMDALKNEASLTDTIDAGTEETRIENAGKDLYSKFGGEGFEETNYKKALEKYSDDGYELEDIQSAVNRAGKESSAFKREKEKNYMALHVDTDGMSKAEKEAVKANINSAASYYAAKKVIPGYVGDRYMEVFDKKLDGIMDVETFISHHATADKKAALTTGTEKLSSKELYAYLETTDYPRAVKSALFEAIGNSNWKNPYGVYTAEQVQAVGKVTTTPSATGGSTKGAKRQEQAPALREKGGSDGGTKRSNTISSVSAGVNYVAQAVAKAIPDKSQIMQVIDDMDVSEAMRKALYAAFGVY